MLGMSMWFACTVEGRDACVGELVCKTAGDHILDRGEEGGERDGIADSWTTNLRQTTELNIA